MPSLNWIATADRFSPAALTVQAQALPPNDQGALLWDSFYTSQAVDSVRISTLTGLDYRPTADRREWNAPGRRVPVVIPGTKEVEMVPIEANFVIDEREMQRLGEAARGNEAIIRDQIAATVPQRVDLIAMAVWRRLEVDAMAAWANGAIVQRNPENAAETFTLSFGFSSSRYTTAGTAWDNGAVNAYTLLQQWIVAAEDLVGRIEGAVMPLNVFNAILADAPTQDNSVVMTRANLQDRVEQDKGGPFRFNVVENKVDVFDDGGTAYTRTRIWPAGKIAAIPAGGKIGVVARAPVVRAWDIAAQAPDQSIDVNGVTVAAEVQNGGKRVEFQAQGNFLPVPLEQSLYVTATGVA